MSKFIESSIGTQPHSFIHIVYGCFHALSTELSSFDRDHMALKAENFYCLLLCRMSLGSCLIFFSLIVFLQLDPPLPSTDLTVNYFFSNYLKLTLFFRDKKFYFTLWTF